MDYSKIRTGLILPLTLALVVGCNSESTQQGSTDSNGSDLPIISPEPTPIEQALATGDVSYISDASSLVYEIENTVTANQVTAQTIKQVLFNIGVEGEQALTDLTWWPTHDAAAFKNTYGVNYAVIESNAIIPAYENGQRVPEALPMAIAGTYQSKGRYLALNANPFRNVGKDINAINTEMNSWLKNAVPWLAQRDDFSVNRPLNIVMSQL